MSKDPAVLFYTSDFLTGTILMSDEQVGKYIRLLCVQHQKGRLSNDDMLKICKTYDKDIFEKFTKDDDGLFFNERLEEEHLRRKAYSKSRSDNRKNKEDIKNISLTYDKHMETENETDTLNEDLIKKRAEKFQDDCLAFTGIYTPAMFNDFILYWTEPNKSNTKMRWEMEKTWDLSRRLGRWNSRSNSKPQRDISGL